MIVSTTSLFGSIYHVFILLVLVFMFNFDDILSEFYDTVTVQKMEKMDICRLFAKFAAVS